MKRNLAPTGTIANQALAKEVLDALDATSGGCTRLSTRTCQGLMCSGTFTPSPEAAKLTRAPHANRPSTPVTVRFSDSTGLPTVPDNDPARSGPRGMAIRFHLGEHAHTDIIAHSTNGFPVRTGKEFVELMHAAADSALADRKLWVHSCQPPECEAVHRDSQANTNEFHPGGLLRRHILQVHER